MKNKHAFFSFSHVGGVGIIKKARRRPCLAIREDSGRKKHLRMFAGGPASICVCFGDLGIFSFGGVFFTFSERKKKNNIFFLFCVLFGNYNLLKNKIFFYFVAGGEKLHFLKIFFVFFVFFS